jgi:hypothetical protein
MPISIAPDAPGACPWYRFVAVTLTWSARAPSALRIAAVSIPSLRGVEEPCAFTWSISSGPSSADSIAIFMPRAAALDDSSGTKFP